MVFVFLANLKLEDKRVIPVSLFDFDCNLILFYFGILLFLLKAYALTLKVLMLDTFQFECFFFDCDMISAQMAFA